MIASEEPATSASMLLRLRDPADREAWGAFAENYGPCIYTWCRRWHLQEADAEDLTQGLLLAIPAKMRAFAYNPQIGSFRSWLKTVVRNALTDFVRAQLRAGKTGSYASLEAIEAEQDLLMELDQPLRASNDGRRHVAHQRAREPGDLGSVSADDH